MLLTKQEKRDFEYDVFVELMKQSEVAKKYRMSHGHIARYLKRVYGIEYKDIRKKRNGITTK